MLCASPVHSISSDIRHIFSVSPEASINTDIEVVGLYAFLNSKPDGREFCTPLALALGKDPRYPLGWRSLCLSQRR